MSKSIIETYPLHARQLERRQKYKALLPLVGLESCTRLARDAKVDRTTVVEVQYLPNLIRVGSLADVVKLL